MKLKTFSMAQLAADTSRIVRHAKKGPILVRGAAGGTLVVRRLVDDELADELISKNPRFRATIRKARRNFAAGKGIPLADLRKRVKT